MALNTTPATQLSMIGLRTWNVADDFLALPLGLDGYTNFLGGLNAVASPATWDDNPLTDQADLRKDAVIFNAYLKKKK